MERQLSSSLGLDVSTPPGTNEIGVQLGHSNLYIKNLPVTVDEPALWQLFGRCGSIEAGQYKNALFHSCMDQRFANRCCTMCCLAARSENATRRILAHPNLMLQCRETSLWHDCACMSVSRSQSIWAPQIALACNMYMVAKKPQQTEKLNSPHQNALRYGSFALSIAPRKWPFKWPFSAASDDLMTAVGYMTDSAHFLFRLQHVLCDQKRRRARGMAL